MDKQEPQQLNTVHTLQVRIFGEDYNQVKIDWSRTKFDGQDVFMQLGQICGIPASRSTQLYLWKNFRDNPVSMLVFVHDPFEPETSEVLGNLCKTACIEMLNTGDNRFVLATFLRIGSDRNLSICYVLIHEDLVEDQCSLYFCQHAHTRKLVDIKRNLIINRELNQQLIQQLIPQFHNYQYLEQRNPVLTRLNVAQYLKMSCTVAENIDQNPKYLYDRRRG